VGFSVGEVLAEAWGLYTRNSGRLILVAAIVFGILSLVYIGLDALQSRALVPLYIGVTILGTLTLQAALTVLVDDLRARRPERPVVDLFRAVLPIFWTLLAAEVVASVGIVGGLILFVVPGLVLLTFWSAIIPAIVLERRGVLECFHRSQYLVSGNALKVFAVIAITVLLSAAVSSVVQLALSPLPRFGDVYVASLVANSLTMPYVAVAWTVMFFELRLAKEGPS
jgi:hypothetical protein